MYSIREILDSGSNMSEEDNIFLIRKRQRAYNFRYSDSGEDKNL